MPNIVNVSPEATILDEDENQISMQVIESTVETSRYDEAATLEIKGLADETPQALNQIDVFGSSVSISVNGTVIGSGMLNSLNVDEEGVVSLEAYDAVRNLATTPVGQEYKSVQAVTILGDILDTAGLEGDPEEGGIIGRPGYEYEGLFEVDDEGDADGNQAFYSSRNFTNTSSLEALQELTLEYGWYWYVNEENIVRVVGNLDPTEHDLTHITETSAGLQTPPYRRVIVTGGKGTGMETGDGETHLLSRTKVQGIAGVEDPTYRYNDSSLHTPEAAQNVAEGILEEFYMQRASGEVTAVGRPDIRPLDVIDLPDELVGENSEFIVSSASHKLNNDDGYLTTINVGSRVDPEEIDTQPGDTGPEDDDIPAPGDDEETIGGDDDTPLPSNPDSGTAG